MLTWLRKSVDKGASEVPFDGGETLQSHREFRTWLEGCVDGNSKEPMPAVATCHVGCMVGKWLHGEGGRNCSDVKLVNSLCGSCETFYEMATNAVLLTHLGCTRMAKTVLHDQRLSDASKQFQSSVAKLHQRYSKSEDPRPE